MLGASPVAASSTPSEVAHAVVSLYLGLELLSHLDGDRAPALALFDAARQLATLADLIAGPPTDPEPADEKGDVMNDTAAGTATHAASPGRHEDTGLDVVTGAFSYSGRAIAVTCKTPGARCAP